MRLLVLTASHAKDLALERIDLLEAQLDKRDVPDNVGSGKCNVAHRLIRQGLQNYLSAQYKAFHRWKNAVLDHHLAICLTKNDTLVLRLALKCAHCCHTSAKAKAFTRWILNNQRAKEGSLLSLAKIRRARRIFCICSTRRALAQWRTCIGGLYKLQLQRATLRSWFNRGLKSRQDTLRGYLVRWRSIAMSMKLTAQLNKRVIKTISRLCNPEADAFDRWRRVVFTYLPRMDKVAGRLFELLHKQGIYYMRSAFQAWKVKIRRMVSAALKACAYMDDNVGRSLKAAFGKWGEMCREAGKVDRVDMQRRFESEKDELQRGHGEERDSLQRGHREEKDCMKKDALAVAADRWKRQFLTSAGLKHRSACRSALATRFKRWYDDTR
jgi:hypothetical protein